LILAGARVSYALARDGLFFKSTGALNKNGVPGSALMCQGVWITILILLRTRKVSAAGVVTYGMLQQSARLLVFAALLLLPF